MDRQTIHYTVELLISGNFNIYEGNQCVARKLRWKNISPTGAAAALGSWVIDWSREEMAKKKTPDEELIATNMEKFKELFMKEAQEFAKHNEGFDAYEALDQVLDDDDIVNDIHKATIEEIPNVVEFAADHYIW